MPSTEQAGYLCVRSENPGSSTSQVTTSEMSAQTIKRQAAGIERPMPGEIPRHVRILDNGGTDHALSAFTQPCIPGATRAVLAVLPGMRSWPLPVRSTRRVLGCSGPWCGHPITGTTLLRLLMMPGHDWPRAIVHGLALAADMFRQTHREPARLAARTGR